MTESMAPPRIDHHSPQMPSQVPHPSIPTPQAGVPVPHVAQVTQPSPRTQPVQTTPVPAAATVKKKAAVATDGVLSTSTPPASASTPANPPTPSHAASSPQTPKSPKAKVQPRPKTTKRRPSTVKGQPPVASAPALGSSTATAPVPAPSTPATAAATPSTDQPSPAARTPDSGLKRKRDDESAANAVTNDLSPKKLKTDWEGPESEELINKKQEVDGIKTDEDATKFLESMTEMLAMATSEGKEVPQEISDTLHQILNNFPAVDVAAFGDTASLRSSSPPLPLADGSEFFDFTLYSEDDHGSKAPTPDLIGASSTNPSPGSGSETESTHGSSTLPDTVRIVGQKADDDYQSTDHLRLGMWKEIDGGSRAAYYTADRWNWDGGMPPLEWPIADH
jgi:hypothetical protein